MRRANLWALSVALSVLVAVGIRSVVVTGLSKLVAPASAAGLEHALFVTPSIYFAGSSSQAVIVELQPEILITHSTTLTASIREEGRGQTKTTYRVTLVSPKEVVEVSPEGAVQKALTRAVGWEGKERQVAEWVWAVAPKKIGQYELQITGLPLQGVDASSPGARAAEIPFRVTSNGTLILVITVLDEYGLTAHTHAVVQAIAWTVSGLGTVGVFTFLFSWLLKTKAGAS